MNSASVSVSSEEDWAVISDEFESMTVGEEEWDFCDQHDEAEKEENVIRKESIEEPENDLLTVSLPSSIPIPIVGGYVHVTYKEMLLKRRRDEEDNNPTINASSSSGEGATKSPWKARIVVQNVPWKRVDRDYGIPPPIVYHDDEDDGGLEDLIAGEYRMKAHVGMCRAKAMTMMSVKQWEKKQARIAQKPTTNVVVAAAT